MSEDGRKDQSKIHSQRRNDKSLADNQSNVSKKQVEETALPKADLGYEVAPSIKYRSERHVDWASLVIPTSAVFS